LFMFVCVSVQAALVPLYRFYNTGNADHFYTINASEGAGMNAEGIAGYVYDDQPSGTVPLYRYCNSAGVHFYTTNWSELGSGGAGYWYEGVACYVRPGAYGTSSKPIYRFVNTDTGAHLYTPDPQEEYLLGGTEVWIILWSFNHITNQWESDEVLVGVDDRFAYEGIAFWVL
jgi:hypothetical protein